MQGSTILYLIFLAVLVVLVGSIFITPFIALNNEADAALSYQLYGYTCHQKISRSYCIFETEEGYLLDDCVPQNGTYTTNDYDILSVQKDSAIGYKFPVCSRDVSLYFFMLIGALIYPLFRDIDDRKLLPPIFLVIAIAPLALDGGLQFLASGGLLPFEYESTNIIRAFTGFLAGFVSSFYIIPLLQHLRS